MQFAPFRTGSALDAYYLGGLSTYWHVVLTAAISFQFLMYVSKWLSRRVVPNHYTALSLRKQYDWDSHFVAFCFSVYICTQALPLIFHPDLIKDKIWGYTPEAATVIATTCGYVYEIQNSDLHESLLGIFCGIYSPLSTSFLNTAGVWLATLFVRSSCTFTAWVLLHFIMVPSLFYLS